MSTAAPVAEPVAPESRRLLGAAAEDLRLLARLHDRELDRELYRALRAMPFRDRLALELRTPEALAALAGLEEGLARLPAEPGEEVLDLLAADFAGLYLTYAFRVGCSESVWLTEDGLERQEPMFEVREWYRHYGLRAENWRLRPDDHLVHQIRFLAFLLEHPAETAARDAARFADRHLRRWLGDFAEGAGRRCHSRFYADLARFTHAYVEELRDLLVAITGEPRWRPPPPGSPSGCGEAAVVAYLPGAGPGW